MKTFKEYNLKTPDDTYMQECLDFLEFIEICESVDELNEAVDYIQSPLLTEEGGGKIDSILKKVGLHAKKTKPGLIKQFKNAGVGMIKFFVALVKGDTETIKKMANKEIKKEDVIEFLVNLDMATLHLFTGYIHSIEAITGWHIGANLHKKTKEVSQTVVTKIKDAFSFIKAKLASSSAKQAKTVVKAIDKITQKTPNEILNY